MIDILTSKILVTQPTGEGRYVDGRFIEGKKETIEIMASVQPMMPSEIKMLPEGRRNFEGIKIYSDVKLKVSDELNNKNASILEYDGKKYEVQRVFNWAIGTDIPHYEILAVKIDGQGGGVNA